MVTQVPVQFLLIAGGVSTVYFSFTSQNGRNYTSSFQRDNLWTNQKVFITHMF